MMMDPIYFLNIFCPKPSKKEKKIDEQLLKDRS